MPSPIHFDDRHAFALYLLLISENVFPGLRERLGWMQDTPRQAFRRILSSHADAFRTELGEAGAAWTEAPAHAYWRMLVNDLQRDVPALREPIDRLRARHDARAAAAEARAAEAAAREARIAELEAALADAAEHLETRAAATTSREFVWTPFPKDEKLVQEMARNWEHFAKIPMLHPAGSDAFEAARRACTEVGEPTTLWVLAHGGSEISDIADSGDAEGENHTFLDAAATVERLIADKVPLGFDRIKVWACWAGVSGFAQGFAAALRGHGFAGEVGGYKGITSTPNGRFVHPSVCPVFDDPEDFQDFIDERLDLDEIRLAREVLERFLPAQ